MKRIIRSAGVLLIVSALFTPAAQAYLTVSGNGTAPATANGTTFALAVNKAVFFRPTGEYYFGQVAGANGNYALSYATYRTADSAPVLTALGTTAPLLNNLIDHLAVVPNSALQTSPTIVVAAGALTNVITALSAVSKSSLTPVAQTLDDTTGAAVTGGIRGLTASRTTVAAGANVVFAAVKVNGGTTAHNFGAGASVGTGAATDGINAALITQTAGAPAYTYVGATAANTARAVDLTATGSFSVNVTAATTVTSVLGSSPALCYDEQLQALYVGIQGNMALVTGGLYGIGIYRTTVTPGVSVAVGAQLLPAGTAADQTTVLVPDTTDKIVGITRTATASAVAMLRLQTMHTSTGMAYLIVNGNVGTVTTGIAANVSKNIFAVPLVNPGAAVAGDVGCFANVNSGGHVLKAAAAGDLVISTSLAAMVGGTGVLPIAFGLSAGVAPAAGGIGITSMYVDGDAVYVATGIQDPTLYTAAAGSGNETGLWKSQAVFNHLGQIDHWTDWQKVAPNDMGGNVIPATGSDPRIDFAAVDAYTGHVLTINNTSLAARVTQWTQPATTNPNSQELLAAAVNNALSSSCYSVLDLNASVTGWGAATATQVTLFGGQEKVCFAVTGSRTRLTTTLDGTYTSVNTVMANSLFDWTQSSTFITTSLPAGAGAVVALGWSGWDGTTSGFFFAGCAGTAGTNPGLYVFSIAGTGFVPNTAGAGTTSLFTGLGLPSVASGVAATGAWTPIANVSGMPIKIQAFGGGLHVLTRSATIDRIYSTPLQSTAATLNSSFVVTASSGYVPTPGSTNSSLASVKQIYDFVVSVSAQSTAIPAIGTEQLLMLTNDGIYTTSSIVGLQAPSANLSQLNAGWVRLDTPGTTSTVLTSGLFSNYIQYPAYNRLPQSFSFANYAVNPAIANVYNKTIQYQMSRQTLSGTGAIITPNTNFVELPNATATFDGAQSFNQTAALTIYQNFPVTYRLFYNDGARRFFIQKNPADDTKYQVLALPYNLYDYNIVANGKKPMADAVVAQAGAFYWMSPIGDTGRLMMGTSSGVISLQ